LNRKASGREQLTAPLLTIFYKKNISHFSHKTVSFNERSITGISQAHQIHRSKEISINLSIVKESRVFQKTYCDSYAQASTFRTSKYIEEF
jgi:hypothetical protein